MSNLNLEIRNAKNIDEVEEAFRVANSSFGGEGIDEKETLYKRINWFNEPSFSLENIIIAFLSGKVIGVVRVVPKVVCKSKVKYKVAGFTSICIDKQARKRGISSHLINKTIDIARGRGFDLAMLVARKAVDHYYNKFGFFGISSYESISIESNTSINQNINLLPLDRNYISIYLKVYEDNYADCFGKVIRSHSQWEFILNLIELRKEVVAFTVFYNASPVGYVIINNNKICELAIEGDVKLIEILSSIKKKLRSMVDWMDLPSNHSLVRNAKNLDIRIQRRECAYGGHMALILKEEKFKNNIENRKDRFSDYSLKNDLNNGYEKIIHLLGCWNVSGSGKLSNEMTPFNLNFLDQF